MLEDYFREKLIEESEITEIGSYWDKRGQNEIDIIALNDMTMKATVIEVKRDPKKADIGYLKKKAGTVGGLKKFEVEYKTLSMDDV